MSDPTALIPIPAGINHGLSPARQATMLALLGSPRSSYGEDCQDMTNAALAQLVVTRDVGPFRARGLRPAVDSLATVMAEIARVEPTVYGTLGSAGMLCARFVRGSATAISNHSWGTAIDLTIDGRADRRGDGLVPAGLAAIAPCFNAQGWYWGAGFGIEDAMHFEAGDALIRRWHVEGRFEPAPQISARQVPGAPVPAGRAPIVLAPPPAPLGLGDRGPEVRALQQRLNAAARAGLGVDGVFGPATRAAVMARQAHLGQPVTGAADPRALFAN